MRSLLLILIALTVCWGSEAAKKPVLDWTQPQRVPHLLNNNYLQVYVFFCANCPNSRRRISTDIKAIHDLIEKEYLPATLVIITPDRNASDLRSWAKSEGLEKALVAQDTANARDISLRNIWQTSASLAGKNVTVNLTPAAFKQDLAKLNARHRFPVEGLDNPLAKQLWWMVERGEEGAIETLVRAAQRSAITEEAQAILEVIKPSIIERQDKLVAADATIETYEALELLVAEAKAIGLKPAEDRLRALSRDPALRDELTARGAYQRIEQELLGSSNVRQRRQAPDAFRQVAERFPQTKYGKLAATRVDKAE